MRQQLNLISDALRSQNSGSTAPTPSIAGMEWFDTSVSPGVLKFRNSENDAWLVVGSDGVFAVNALAAIGNISAILGQAYEEIERLSGSSELVATAQDLSRGVLLEIASILGQVSDQINGGRATLSGGTLADPALRIGTVGVYSSAVDTLSIAIAGTEVARFTASGLTVYGTVTEV